MARRDFILLVLTFGLALIVQSPAALGHEGWEWIARNPDYVGPDGSTHCCSADCGEVDERELTIDADGIIFNGTKLYFRNPGIYWTEDSKTRVCRRSDGTPRCVFRLHKGS